MPTPRHFFDRFAKFFHLESWLRFLMLCVLAGAIAGLAAVVLDRGLHYATERLFTYYLDRDRPGGLLDLLILLVLPAAGLLLAGYAAWRWAPEVGGGGVDAVIRAFHRGQGQIRARVTVLQALCTILTIGSGGSAGKDGPSAQIGAGIGSSLGRALGLSARDRRILMLSGCAAGLGAILRAPLGGALFAAEMLYRDPDFEHDAVIPSVISSVTAYSVFTAILGFNPVLSFTVGDQAVRPQFPTAGGSMFGELLHYALLSLLCAVVAYLIVKGLRLFRVHLFKRLPVGAPLKPLLGGLALGALAAILFVTLNMKPDMIMADGKSYVQQAIEHILEPDKHPVAAMLFTVRALALVIFFKIVATALTVGSGASGGLLFPTLFIGAITGALYAKLWLPAAGALPDWLNLTAEARAGMIMVAMGGVFCGTTKTTIASLVMVCEMTGSYALAVPLMLCCASTYLLTTSFSLEEEQVPGMADSPAHRGDFLVNVLEDLRVSHAIAGRPRPELIPADLPFPQVLERLKHSQATTFPVVDENDCLVGVFSLGDIRQIMNEQSVGGLVVAGDLGTPQVVTVKPETRLSDALTLFTQKNVNELPVVEDAPSGTRATPLASKRIRAPRGPVGSKRVLGMLTRQDLIRAYCQRVQELQAAEAQEAQGSTVLKDAQESLPEALPPSGVHPAVREEEAAAKLRRTSPVPVAEEEMLKDPHEHAAGETAPPEETPGLPEEPEGKA